MKSGGGRGGKSGGGGGGGGGKRGGGGGRSTDHKRDELLQTFVSCVNCDVGEALSILEAYDWDVNTALLHYEEKLEGGNNEVGKKSAKTKSPVKGIGGEEGVRAPIPAKVMGPLVGTVPVVLPPPPRKAKSVFESFNNCAGKLYKECPKTNRLEDLYRPPFKIMYQAPFEKALAYAESKAKYLLVNIQVDHEFDCHLMNRDTWSSQPLQNLITSEFIFWQRFHNDIEGKKYCERYPTKKYPHIAILDPKCGYLIESWEGLKSSADLIDLLNAFLQNSTPLNTSLTPKTTDPTPKKENLKTQNNKYIGREIADWSEEEQLKMAVNLSLKNSNLNSKSNKLDSDEEDTYEEGNEKDDEKPKTEVEVPEEQEDTKTKPKKRHFPDADETAKPNNKKLKGEPPSKTQKKSYSSTANEKESSESPKNSTDPSSTVHSPSTTTTNTTTSTNANTPKKKQIITFVEPDLSNEIKDATLQIRFPDNTVIKAEFSSKTYLKTVLNYALHQKQLENDGKEYTLVTNYPLKRFTEEELFSKTLKETNLFPRAVVIVEMRDC